MGNYIAFHRAINVSGSKIIKMEHLRTMFADMGFKNVASYIQTGNVYFETKATDTDKLAKKIESHLEKELGFEVETFVYTVEELAQVIKKDPFKKIEDDGNAVIYIGFLQSEPEKELVEKLYTYNSDVDTFKVLGKVLYILRYRDKGKSIMTPGFIEKKLKMKCTTRNRKTIHKLLDLYGQ
ncbi:MAG: DUF1697 domain-containing protein [Chitinophagales bacterium]|nr:DUF1697 domain-containing protein [Chitinophagaceae bacterium]MCB9064787.1 DUF1697 domain-containing protein [Chitinophagales bacterium]